MRVLCVLMVFTDRCSASAMSVSRSPATMRRSTSSSRSDSWAWRGTSTAPLSCCTTRSARLAVT